MSSFARIDSLGEIMRRQSSSCIDGDAATNGRGRISSSVGSSLNSNMNTCSTRTSAASSIDTNATTGAMPSPFASPLPSPHQLKQQQGQQHEQRKSFDHRDHPLSPVLSASPRNNTNLSRYSPVPMNEKSHDPYPKVLEHVEAKEKLTRVLSWWSLTSMGIGATIGAGIFVMTGIVAHNLTGPALSLSFVFAAIACGLAGLCYAEFAALAPSAGSAYAYTRASMGQFLAWMIGWDLILEYSVSAAAVAQSWSQYLNEFLSLFSVSIPHVISSPPFTFDSATGVVAPSGAAFDLPALLITLILTSLLVCGVRDSARFNNVMVAIKIGIVFFVIIFGATLVDTANWTPFAPYGYLGFSFFGKNLSEGPTTKEGNAVGVLAGASIVFFAYIGFDSTSCNAEEAKKPERDLPISIILSLIISTILYIGVSIVLTGMVNYKDINIKAPLSTAFSQRGHYWSAYLIAAGAITGITSVLLITLLAQPRIFMAMSRDKLLPSIFGDIHPRFHTPWKATIITGVSVALISSLIPLTILVEFVSIGTLMAFTFVCISVIVLRHTKPDIYRPFRCPLVPFIPGLGALCCITLMFSLPATNWYRLLAWFAIGALIYYFYGRKYGIGDDHRLQTRDQLDTIAVSSAPSSPRPTKSSSIPQIHSSAKLGCENRDADECEMSETRGEGEKSTTIRNTNEERPLTHLIYKSNQEESKIAEAAQVPTREKDAEQAEQQSTKSESVTFESTSISRTPSHLMVLHSTGGLMEAAYEQKES